MLVPEFWHTLHPVFAPSSRSVFGLRARCVRSSHPASFKNQVAVPSRFRLRTPNSSSIPDRDQCVVPGFFVGLYSRDQIVSNVLN